MSNTDTRAAEQARAQYANIVEMVAALNVDYDRLEELRETREDCADTGEPMSVEDLDELAKLERAAGDCTSRDEALERIQEDPLSVLVRSGWCVPGDRLIPPEEFEILLCTGGPAVRIVGTLSHCVPQRAWLECQDWGAPWAEVIDGIDSDVLDAYVDCFYFGD